MNLRSAAAVLALSLIAVRAVAADAKPAAPPKPAEKPAPAAAKAAATVSISGKVAGPGGKPVASAVVRAIPVASRTTTFSLRGGGPPDVPKAVVAKTDEKGAFKLDGLTGGPFSLRVEAPGLAPAFAASVPAGASLNLSLKAGLPVYGRVLDLTTQKPIAGATVTALEQDAARFGRDAAHTVTSAENGTFKIADCASGVVTVAAIAPAKARAELERVAVRALPDGEEPKYEANTLFLRPGGRLAGRVLGADGKPVADAIVAASATDGSLMAMIKEGRLARRTDEKGAFAFDGVPAGNKYTLRATKQGFAADEAGPFQVDPGTDRGDVDLKLETGASLAFRLVTADDTGVKDVDVRLQAQNARRGRGFGFGGGNDVDRDKIVPQGDGKFLVKALEAGTFDLTLAPVDFADVTKEGLKLKSGETLDLGTLRVKESKSVSGKLTDVNGQPVAGAGVSGLWFDGTTPHSRETKSAADGKFKLSGLGDDPMRNLWVRADGFAQASREGVAPGDTAVDFVLEKTGSVIGKVVLANGAPPPAFRVQAFPEAKENEERPGLRLVIRNRADEDKVFADASGNFRLDNVDPGMMTIAVLADGKAPSKKAGVKITSDEVTDIGTVRLEDGRTLRGRVIAAKDDAPIPGATVTVTQPQGFGRIMSGDPPAGSAITSLDGHFEIAGLEARTYAVDAGQPDYSPSSGRVEIVADQDPDDFIIHLSKGGTITGMVRDANRQPIPQAGVLLVSPSRGDGGPQSASTGPDGRYTFDKIAPGDYMVIRAPSGGGPLMLFGGMKSVAVREGEVTTYDIDEAAKVNASGRVLKAGQPVPNAMVFFTTPDPNGEAGDLRQTRTDENGHYQIGLDKGGTYMVMVTTMSGMFGGARSAVSVEVPDGPNPVVDVTLKGASITGHVTSNQDGKPVSGAVVTASATGSAASGTTGGGHGGLQGASQPDGSFSVDGVDAGTYKLTVAASGYRNAEIPSVAVSGDADTPSVEVHMDKGGTLHGRVVDAGGAGIAGAMVMAAPSGTVPANREALPATSDINGGFVLTVPADGPIDVTAVAAGFPAARVNGVVPDADSDLAITAPRGAPLRLTVLTADGHPAVGARVVCRAVPAFLGSDFASFLNPIPPTGADGVAVATSLAPGSYELTVSLNQQRATKAFNVVEGGQSVQVVTLP
ncbi:MAG TPA: carboxypeptidase-like regulatory domain-containing protein [Candidatus Polarisedimenticolaceae bacterium]|nr:carboxypeptidase-like regulatory domain-containing protein [Candidatus Polarisedimenticolaceae bacterium]